MVIVGHIYAYHTDDDVPGTDIVYVVLWSIWGSGWHLLIDRQFVEGFLGNFKTCRYECRCIFLLKNSPWFHKYCWKKVEVVFYSDYFFCFDEDCFEYNDCILKTSSLLSSATWVLNSCRTACFSVEFILECSMVLCLIDSIYSNVLRIDWRCEYLEAKVVFFLFAGVYSVWVDFVLIILGIVFVFEDDVFETPILFFLIVGLVLKRLSSCKVFLSLGGDGFMIRAAMSSTTLQVSGYEMPS